MGTTGNAVHREPWNKGKIVGQKAPFKPKDIWALRVRLQMVGRVRELALFNLGIDSKLRGCDLVALKVRDVCHGDQVATRAIVISAQDPASSAVRDHAGHPGRLAGLDQTGRAKAGGLPVPQPPAQIASSRNSPVRPDPRALGRRAWSGLSRLRHTLDAQDQGDADLPAHQEPARRATAAWTFQAGIDGEIPWHRGR